MQNTEHKREYNRGRYQKRKEKMKADAKRWYFENRDKINERKRALRRERGLKRLPNGSGIPRTYQGVRKLRDPEAKNKILAHYGQSCACCGESTVKLLTVDHIENNGKEHGTANTRYKGYALYETLIRLQYPTGIQILCFNCNIGRRNNKGICPHKITK